MTSSYTPLFIDCETEPVSHAYRLPTFVVGAIAFGDEIPHLVNREDFALAINNAPLIVGHNLAFDVAVCGADRDANYYDTSIRAVLNAAIAGDRGDNTSLAHLAAGCGLELSGKGSTQLSFRPGVGLTDEQREYAKQDVIATRAVWKAQGGTARVPDEGRQTRISHAIFRMAREGVSVDVPRVRASLSSLAEARGRLRDELKEAGLIEPRGPKKDPWREEAIATARVQERLAAAGCTLRTEGGLLASSEEILLKSRDPVLAKLGQLRGNDKLSSLFRSFDINAGIARARWKPLVVTGRVACAEPNLTNIPRHGGLRECIIPSVGNVLIGADYPALEMRTWAQVCYTWLGRSTLRSLWEEGKDPHWMTAASILHSTYQDALDHPKGREIRQVAKALNFGLPGGMGANRLREHLREQTGLDPGPWGAERLRNAWFKTYPEAADYFAYIREHDYTTALPWSGRIRKALYSEACNYPFQGTGSDVAKEALLLAQERGLRVVALVHDELLMESPVQDAQEAANQLCRAMKEAGERVCPDVPWEGIRATIYRERWSGK